MKINVLLVLVAFTFFTFLGLTIGEHLYQLKMAEQGLQQCVIAIDPDTYEAVWTKDCPK